eukprot:gene5687-8981_t
MRTQTRGSQGLFCTAALYFIARLCLLWPPHLSSPTSSSSHRSNSSCHHPLTLPTPSSKPPPHRTQ